MRVGTVGLLVLGACRFDPAGLPGEAGPAELDATPGDAAGGPDASLCGAVTAVIVVDGTPHSSTTAPAEAVLVGDTVALSSAGSCGPGALTYAWQVSPVNGIRDTIAPSDSAGAITVYPTLPDAYSATLTVRDAGGATATATVYAFDAIGFAGLAGVPNKVHDLDVGDGQVWAATESGAVRAPLGLLAPVTSVNGEAIGAGVNALPTKQMTLLWDDARALLWIGAFDPATGVWRVDYGGAVRTSLLVADAAVLGGNTKTADLALVAQPITGTVAAATDRGVAFSPDGVAFATAFVPAPPNVSATTEAEATWALGDALHDLDAATTFPIFNGGKPSGMVADLDGGVWLGNEMMGVAHVEPVGAGIQITPFDTTTGLPSNNARALTIERDGPFAGDVWVATQKGLARWKVDRQVWVSYGNLQGLTGVTDLRAVAVAGGGSRAVFAGGTAGAVYAAVP